eukprot:CAMPEP_0206233866 /NCGR_PEP_ID=MMETSP0047_2-20121206/12255_1 /ASSEMBLY_ACC=CAM_ASM_000192 /TAXON_ID=195065 /ORGANISM="Chroomonas mesostigmatica_cf, Strain CCMP1168" /LENGTH=516 /DNA_ID=CAMNT_0053657853 /DNA_START=235 /DNA_END=1785 /DNA_ORIENTATION=+
MSYIDIVFEDRVYMSCTNGMYSGILECSLIANLLDADGVYRRMRTASLWDAATFSRIPWHTRGGGYEALRGPCDWMISRGLMNPLPDGANCDFALTNDWLNTLDGWMYAGYDPTSEPSYASAPRAPQDMVWGTPFVSTKPPADLVVRLSRGIFDQTGIFRGVGTSSVRLQSVDDTIKAWPLDNKQATVIAFDNMGAVLGTSMPESTVTTSSRTPNQVTAALVAQGCFLSAQDSTLCRIMITDGFFFPALAELATMRDLFDEDFTDRVVILGQRYYVSKQQVPVRGSTGLAWYVILFVPNWDLHNTRVQLTREHHDQGYDYYGEVVNKAACVEGLALGGQTLVSTELFDYISSSLFEQCCTRLVGTKALKGIVGVCEIYSVLPKSLATRDLELQKLEASKISGSVEQLIPAPRKQGSHKLLIMNSFKQGKEGKVSPLALTSSSLGNINGGVGVGEAQQQQGSRNRQFQCDEVTRFKGSSKQLSMDSIPKFDRLPSNGSTFSHLSQMSSPRGVATPMR